jgi:hypothetical protein
LLCERLDVTAKRFRRRLPKLNGFARDRHRIVADAFERHVHLQHRRNEPQMPRRRQMPRDEGVTQLVDGADLAVDRQITEDDSIARFAIGDQQSSDGARHCVYHARSNFHDAPADFDFVRGQTLFVATHFKLDLAHKCRS